jgi:hypothetical protein
MDSVKYIGMDVHKEAISIAVLNSSGKLVMERVTGPTPVARREPRSIIRSQHLLNQGRPPGSERLSLSKDCGWKDGDRGGSVKRLGSTDRNTKTVLTTTGLLMEGVIADQGGKLTSINSLINI